MWRHGSSGAVVNTTCAPSLTARLQQPIGFFRRVGVEVALDGQLIAQNLPQIVYPLLMAQDPAAGSGVQLVDKGNIQIHRRYPAQYACFYGRVCRGADMDALLTGRR